MEKSTEEEIDNSDNVSEISNLSGLSEEAWKPTSGKTVCGYECVCVDFRVLGSTNHFHHMIKSATDNSHLIDTFCWQPYLFYGVNCRRNKLLGYVSLKECINHDCACKYQVG